MVSKIKYVDKLPTNNTSTDFIILRGASDRLGKDWYDFVNNLVTISCDEENENFTHLRSTLKGDGDADIFSLPYLASTMLGTGGDFKVIDGHDKGKAPFKTYEDFIEIYNNKVNTTKNKKDKYETIIKSNVDRFLAYQWRNKKLLYPLYYGSGNHHRHKSWQYIVGVNELSEYFSQYVLNDKRDKTQSRIRIANFNALLTTTQWYSTKDVVEKDLTGLQEYIQDKRTKFGIGKYLRVVNDFRLFLISCGHKKISSPTAVIKRRGYSVERDKGNNIINYFAFVDIDLHPTLKKLVDYGDGYAKRLNSDGLATRTIILNMRMAKKFIVYVLEYYPDENINIALIEEMFNPKNPKNILDALIKSYKGGRNHAIKIIHEIAKFLVHCDLYSARVKKFIPVRKKKIVTEPYRSAMPKEMVRDILDILKNRPPSSKTKWSKTKVDTGWWEHDEYPVFPLMLLFHYYIPLRGNQIRHLCRSASFSFDSNDRIENFIINTDKNVNRKYLQEIPCVWEDLQIFVPFLKWHKEYFPNIPKIKYQDDPNSPWEDIEPLMVLPTTLKSVSYETHALYHKKVLCQYQLEVSKKAKEQGLNSYPIVAWSKTSQPFFQTIEEINEANTYRMKDVAIMYDIHSLRVTGATRYLESGVGLSVVMELTGHMSAETLTRIYIRLTRDEKKVKLKTAIDEIYFGDKENIIENCSSLIGGQLSRAYALGEKELKTALESNGLFSLHRKASPIAGERSRDYELGTDLAIKQHPTSWIPMIHGICPAVKCPEGRENKCSLCPYLITGRLFMEGVAHRTNLTFADFQRKSLILQSEKEKGYRNHALGEELETKLEEILGWQQVLTRIDTDLQSDNNGKENQLITTGESVFGTEVVDTNLAYLKNAHNAKLMGVEQDIFGLKALTIMAISVVNKKGDSKQVELLIQDETKAIDLLMQYYYSGEIPNTQETTDFIDTLGVLPKPK